MKTRNCKTCQDPLEPGYKFLICELCTEDLQNKAVEEQRVLRIKQNKLILADLYALNIHIKIANDLMTAEQWAKISNIVKSYRMGVK